MAADFSWRGGRGAGVFMHISSLPSEFGIGNVGETASRFLGFLEKCGFSYWQICPLGPTGYGDSPYQPFSAFAGNPYFIDFSELAASGLLCEADIAPLKSLPRDRCDYGAIYELVPPLLRKAAANFRNSAPRAQGGSIPTRCFPRSNASSAGSRGTSGQNLSDPPVQRRGSRSTEGIWTKFPP